MTRKIRHILDTSALLCHLRDERGAEKVRGLITDECGFHSIHLGELYYAVLRKDGLAPARQIYGAVLQYPFKLLTDLDDAVLLLSGSFKVDFNLGFADA